MKDRSDDPSYHERMLLPRSYISLPQITDFYIQTFGVATYCWTATFLHKELGTPSSLSSNQLLQTKKQKLNNNNNNNNNKN